MPRQPRIPVPVFDPQPETEPAPEAEYAPPGEAVSSPEPDMGDVNQLADQRYSDYSWSVWRQRTAEEISRNPKAGPRSFVTRIVGPVDIMAFQNQHGGGIYEFWAYLDQGDGNGKRFRFKQVYPIDGPRKDSAPAAPAAAAPAQDPQLANALGAIAAALGRLEARVAAPPAAAAPAFPFKEVVELSKLISERAAPPPALAGASVTEMMGLIEHGIELGKMTQPGSEPSTMAIVLEKLAPSIEKLAGTLISRRNPPPPRRSPADAVASSAQVVTDPERPEPPNDDQTRMTAAIDALARALIEKMPPEDFAFVLGHILSREQVAMLELGTTEQIMGQLKDSGIMDKYPILATEAAAPYLDSVLTELRNPSQDEDGDEGAGE